MKAGFRAEGHPPIAHYTAAAKYGPAVSNVKLSGGAAAEFVFSRTELRKKKARVFFPSPVLPFPVANFG